MSLLMRLRDQTRTQHEFVERQLGPLDRPWSAAHYRGLLRRFLGYYGPLEDRIQGAEDWVALGFDWPRRQKAPLLDHDLRLAGDSSAVLADLPRCLDLPLVDGMPRALGCLYVLEGATLGGRVIVRHLAKMPELATGAGFSFFFSYGADVDPMWRAFREFLSDHAADCDDAIVAAACETFTTLGRWLAAGPLTRPV